MELGFSNGKMASVQDAEALFNAGTYAIKLKVKTDKGCTATSLTRPLIINPRPQPDFDIPEICLTDGTANFINKSKIDDGTTAQLRYVWQFGDLRASLANPDTSLQVNAVHRYTDTGFYNVHLKVISGEGCAADAAKIFIVNGTQPQANFILKDSLQLCSNKNVVIENNSYVDFGKITRLQIFWDSGSEPLREEDDLHPVKGKTYTHTYPVSYGTDKTYTIKYVAYSGSSCMSEMKQSITMKVLPDIRFDTLNAVCEHTEPFFINKAHEVSGVDGQGMYSGKGIGSDGLFDAAVAGPGLDTLQYFFTTAAGCIAGKPGLIRVWTSPYANAGDDKFKGENETVQLNGNGNGTNYSWTPLLSIVNPATASPFVSPGHTTRYTLTVISADGCTASDDVLVKVFSRLNIQNAFTPNNDGLNDVWKIPLVENYGNTITVQIFNRAGSRIFYSEGYSSPWDGTYKGEPLAAAAYVYVISFKKGLPPVSGTVSIIRI